MEGRDMIIFLEPRPLFPKSQTQKSAQWSSSKTILGGKEKKKRKKNLTKLGLQDLRVSWWWRFKSRSSGYPTTKLHSHLIHYTPVDLLTACMLDNCQATHLYHHIYVCQDRYCVSFSYATTSICFHCYPCLSHTASSSRKWQSSVYASVHLAYYSFL
jgi:hypothetical protein